MCCQTVKRSDNKCKTGLENWIQLISLELRGRPGISVNTRQWHSFRTVLSWYGETVSRVRDLESWCHTVSMNNKHCKTLTDSDRHCSKSWKVLISDEQWIEIFSFFFFFLTSFQCRTFFFVFVLFIAEQFICSPSQTYTRATHTGWYIMMYHSVSVCETWWFSDDRGCV